MEAVRLGNRTYRGEKVVRNADRIWGGQRKTVKKSAEIPKQKPYREKSVHLFLGSTIVWRNYVFENRLHRRRQWFICST